MNLDDSLDDTYVDQDGNMQSEDTPYLCASCNRWLSDEDLHNTTCRKCGQEAK